MAQNGDKEIGQQSSLQVKLQPSQYGKELSGDLAAKHPASNLKSNSSAVKTESTNKDARTDSPSLKSFMRRKKDPKAQQAALAKNTGALSDSQIATATSCRPLYESTSSSTTASTSSAPASLPNDSPIYDDQHSNRASKDIVSSSLSSTSFDPSSSNPHSEDASPPPTHLTSAREATRDAATHATAATTEHDTELEESSDDYETETDDEELFVPENTSPPQSSRRKRRAATVDNTASATPQQPPKRRKRSSKAGEIPRVDHRAPQDIQENGGPFTHEEVVEFSTWKQDYRNAHNLTEVGLRNLLTRKARKSDKRLHNMYVDLYSRFPERDKKSLRKFARRNADHAKRGGGWTKTEDDTLKQLKVQHPTWTWAQLGEALSRFHEDVRNRWRDKIEPSMRGVESGHWKPAEEALYHAYATCAHKAEGSVPAWPAICQEMEGSTRSRVQCTQKWTALKKRAGHEEKLEAVRAEVEAAIAAAATATATDNAT